MAKQQVNKDASNKRRKTRRNVTSAIAFIKATFNNTHVTITDTRGDTLCWASAGTCNFKGSRKSTPFAGQMAAQQAAEKAAKFGVKVTVKQIEDTTPIPHNGCRPRKRRRV